MLVLLNRHLRMQIKYAFPRGNTVYWQRKVPKDLAHRYPSAATLKINLKTQDPAIVATKVARLNKQHEALWETMRRDPDVKPQSIEEQARQVLRAHGIDDPKAAPDEDVLAHFADKLNAKREAWAELQEDPEEAYQEAQPEDFLTKPEAAAIDLLKRTGKYLLSDALETYLQEHPKRGKPGFSGVEEYAHRVWGQFVSVVGDKVFEEVSREDAKRFRDSLLASMKTTSARRSLNVARAVCTSAIADRGLVMANPFQRLSIAGLGEDSTKRNSFTGEELTTLRGECIGKDDDVRWLAAIQLETGARVAEIAGLALGDIRIAHETPHIVIQPHPWRTLKNANSARAVPLLGVALWAAKRIKETTHDGQQHAFPRYITGDKCKADTASATINKWIAAYAAGKTTHVFRHTMRDRLRNTGATRDIQDAVGGWGKSEIQDTYGEGYALKMLRDALQKTVPEAAKK